MRSPKHEVEVDDRGLRTRPRHRGRQMRGDERGPGAAARAVHGDHPSPPLPRGGERARGGGRTRERLALGRPEVVPARAGRDGRAQRRDGLARLERQQRAAVRAARRPPPTAARPRRRARAGGRPRRAAERRRPSPPRASGRCGRGSASPPRPRRAPPARGPPAPRRPSAPLPFVVPACRSGGGSRGYISPPTRRVVPPTGTREIGRQWSSNPANRQGRDVGREAGAEIARRDLRPRAAFPRRSRISPG